MIRLFVGIALPPALRQTLAQLASGLPQARLTPPENLHLTLRFIGEVDEVQAEAVDLALAEITAPSFTLTIAGCGAFDSGSHRAHTLWAGVERADALLHLHDKVEWAVVGTGLPHEGRKYTPHITLARLRATPLAKVQAMIAGNNLLKESVPVASFTLFSSRLGHGNPVYTAEAEYPLGTIPSPRA
jgi:2'-5' RNA ligase